MSFFALSLSAFVCGVGFESGERIRKRFIESLVCSAWLCSLLIASASSMIASFFLCTATCTRYTHSRQARRHSFKCTCIIDVGATQKEGTSKGKKRKAKQSQPPLLMKPSSASGKKQEIEIKSKRHSPHTQHKHTRQARDCTNRQYEEHWKGKRARFSTMSPSSPTTTPP